MANYDDSKFELFEKEVKNALKAYKRNHKEFDASDNKVQTSFLELGKTLAKASEGLRKKTFKQLKESTANELGKNDIRNIDKVVKVAKCANLDNYAERLPSSWATLYLVASLKKEELEILMLDETIDANISRTELSNKIKVLKAKPHVQKSVSVKKLNGSEISPEDKQLLEQLLKNNGWKIHVPASK
jgi:hypothetical protein